MTSLFFWKNWTPAERFLYTTAFVLLLLNLLALLFFEYRGLENIVQWDILSELDDVAVIAENMPQIGALAGKSYILKEQFVPSLMNLPQWFIYDFVGVLLMGWVFILSAISALKRLWYIVAMVIFITILAFSHLELLKIIDQNSNIALAIVLIVLIGITYYFQAFKTAIPMPQRIFIMGIVVGLLVATFGALSHNSHAAYTLAAYSLLPMVFVASIFVVWLSVELIAAFVYITTNARTGFGKNSLYNFLFLSGLYLLSLVLLYLKINRQIAINVWFISPIAIYTLSVILGIWGFEKRIETVFSMRHIGVWLYIGIALVSTATIGYIVFSANNPYIEFFEDTIVYTQLAISTVFTFYIALNFLPIFKQGKAVYKIIYKPMRIAQSQVWLIGIGVFVVLMAFRNFYSFYQGIAGHFNTLGDLYTTTQEYKVAEQYYQMASTADYQNHKSSFGLASLALRQNDRMSAGVFFRQALYKDPSPQAYAGLSKIMLDEGLFFDAIFNLRKGVEVFEKNGELYNNLGAIYTNTQVADSAYYYLEMAARYAKRAEIPRTNLLAFMAKTSLSNKDITNINIYNPATYLSEETNRIALLQQLKQKTDEKKIPLVFFADSALSVNNFAYLYNYTQYTADTSLAPLINRLINIGNNGNFYHELEIVQAFSLYKKDKVAAFDILASEIVADTSKKVALARYTLNYWLNKENITPTPNLTNLQTSNDYINALKQSPFNIALLQQTVNFYNRQKQPQIAYEAILRAKRFNQNNTSIQKLYILQALELGLTEFASDELMALKANSAVKDYNDFFKIYNDKKAAIKNEQNKFQF